MSDHFDDGGKSDDFPHDEISALVEGLAEVAVQQEVKSVGFGLHDDDDYLRENYDEKRVVVRVLPRQAEEYLHDGQRLHKACYN